MARYLKFALLGHPVSQSLSRKMHNQVMQELNLPGQYDLIDVNNLDFQTTLKHLVKNQDYIGFNITIPHKILAKNCCQNLTTQARLTGCVNTIKYENKEFYGCNTDVFGFRKACNTWLTDPDLKTALVIGSGGASRAVLANLGDFDKVYILSRNIESGRQLLNIAHNLSGKNQSGILEIINLNNIDALFADFGRKLDQNSPILMINASPIGVYGNILPPWFEALFKHISHKVKYYDLNYSKNSEVLPSIKLAQKYLIESMDGLTMLAYQGKLAFEHWTNFKIDYEIFYNSLVKSNNLK